MCLNEPTYLTYLKCKAAFMVRFLEIYETFIDKCSYYNREITSLKYAYPV